MPAAQAATEVMVGPRMPRLMATWQEAIFGAMAGTVKGPDPGRTLLQENGLAIGDGVLTPPPPVFMITAVSSRLLSSITRPACSAAWRAAATANWEKRAARRAAFASMYRLGSQSLTSAAI